MNGVSNYVRERAYSRVSEFVHDHGDAIAMAFSKNSPVKMNEIRIPSEIVAYLSSVDLPAPRKPQMIVRGTLTASGSAIGCGSCSMSVLC